MELLGPVRGNAISVGKGNMAAGKTSISTQSGSYPMIYVMLPAYNEAETLAPLLESFERLFREFGITHKVVIVDDGSTDSTASIAEHYATKMPVELLKHGVNKGLGAAMRTGLAHVAAVSSDRDCVVTMDADNTHNPEILSQMLDAIEQEGADVVIASRYEEGGDEVGLALHRKILSRGASFLLDLFFRVKGARDYTCGYRLYRTSVIKNAFKRYGDNFIEENSFVCMGEILIKAAYLPARVTEVPLVLRYDLKRGSSKMRKLQTIMRYLRFILRQKRNRLRPGISQT